MRSLFWYDLEAAIWVGSLLVDAFLIAGGFGLIIALSVVTAPRRCGAAQLALWASPVLIGISVWGLGGGKWIGKRVKLWRNEDHYLESVRIAEENPKNIEAWPSEVYLVDPGPPPRVSFAWGGMLDNWCGVVHDPSGRVLKHGFDPGGVTLHVEHLWGNWYFCSFT